MKAIRVIRHAISTNQVAQNSYLPTTEILDTETGERTECWGVTIGGPSRLVWSETADSPWAPRQAVHCWIETSAPVLPIRPE